MSMADRDGVIWYDGKLVPWREANTITGTGYHAWFTHTHTRF